MASRPRRPGDQAPPPRPHHKNAPPRNSRAYQKEPPPPGTTYRVHDGSPEEQTIAIDGVELKGLSQEDAKRAKDFAAFKKYRQATIVVEESSADAMASDLPSDADSTSHLAVVAKPAAPELTEVRKQALRAGAGAAAAANTRQAARTAAPVPAQPSAQPSLASIDQEGDLGDGALHDLIDDVGDMPGDDEIAAANTEVARQDAGKALYATLKADGDRAWADLTDEDREPYCGEAEHPEPADRADVPAI